MERDFKWFRDNYSLYHSIGIDQTMEPKFCYTISWYKTNPDETVEWVNFNSGQEFFLERTYEQAEEACLKRMSEIVNNEME